MSARAGLVLVLAAVLGACADPGPKPKELEPLKALVKPRVAWSASTGDPGSYVFSPALWEGDYFVAGTDGVLKRLDGRNGRSRWSASVDEIFAGGVAAGGGLVFAGTAKGAVLAFDAATGKQRWSATVSSEVLSTPVLAESLLVVRSGDGHIRAIDVADGSRRWEYLPVNPPALGIRNPFPVRVAQGVVYAGLAGGRMVALRLENGSLLWEAAVAQPKGETELERVADVLSTPLVEDGQACAVSFQGRIACFDAERGVLAWARNASTPGGLASSRSGFYFVDEASHLNAVDRSSGASLWKLDQFAYRSLGPPAVVGRYVVVGDFEGYLHIVNQDDGRVVGRVSTGGDPIAVAPLVVSDNSFTVQTLGGRLYAVSVP